jgi:hypothetical protein
MAGKEVMPQLGVRSFSCPHCGALASQGWFKLLPSSYDRNEEPILVTADDLKTVNSTQWRRRIGTALLRLSGDYRKTMSLMKLVSTRKAALGR